MFVNAEEVFTQLSVDDGGVTGRREFMLAWNDVADFFGELYGVYTDSSGGVVVQQPQSWPGVPALVVRGLEAVPFLPDSPKGNQNASDRTIAVADFSASNLNTTYGAKVTVTYRCLPPNGTRDGKPDVPAGTFLEFESESSETALTVPGRFLKWFASGQKVPHDMTAPVPIYNEDIRLIWHRVTRPPFTAMRKLKGTVNSDYFCRHNPGTVIYVGSSVRYEFQLGNTILYTVGHHFRVKEAPGTKGDGNLYGWNYMYRKDVGASGENWQAVVNDDSGNDIYPDDTELSTNGFADLFNYDS